MVRSGGGRAGAAAQRGARQAWGLVEGFFPIAGAAGGEGCPSHVEKKPYVGISVKYN